MSRHAHIARWAAGAIVAVLVLAAGPARAQNYPRLGMFVMVYDDGFPLWGADGIVDPTALQQFARYDEIVMQPTPFLPYRPEVIDQLRALQPQIKLLAYVTGEYIWYSASADSLVHFPTRYWRTVRDLDGFLYNTQGQLYGSATYQFGDVNLGKRDALGHYVVAEALAALFYDAVLKYGKFDGLFVDTYCDDITWMQDYGETIDYRRAGYPDLASFKAGFKAGSDTLASRLRALGGSATILVGNCGQGTRYTTFNGWMRENFPYQNGGTWFSNMYRDPGGYFLDEQRFRAPQHNYLYSVSGGLHTPYTSDNTRKLRFGLGSAALGGGFNVFGIASSKSKDEPFYTWWYDEYAVDLSTGTAVTDRRYTGWLGQPLSGPYQMMWITTGTDAVVNSDFETDVTTGWSFFSADAGAGVTQDLGSAAHGAASARVTVPVADPTTPWRTSWATTGTLMLSTGGYYSATFWARASQPRVAQVVAARLSGGGGYAQASFTLGTTWQRYQVVLTSTATAPATLQFMLASAAGDVWFDDVHFQAGVNSVYRRDFQNGIVLVNPGLTTQSVVLERPFRRILGVADPVANDGVEASTVNIPGMDARFLIGSDQIPPRAIQDLHPVSPTPSPGPRAP